MRSSLVKKVHFLRHGQALHNPRAEAARQAGCSFDDFLDLMKQDDAFDADLTPLGRTQAQSAASEYEARVRGVQLVVASPLSRAVETAMLVMPDRVSSAPFVAHELLRERSGWMLNAKRRSKVELQARFPGCSFELLETEEDALWKPEELEPTSDCAERGYKFLCWLWERREETELAVVAHGGLFHYLLNEHPCIRANPAAAARFGNTEMRTYSLTCATSGDQRVFNLEVDADHS
jgi:broad specificity phosphatase PhoE